VAAATRASVRSSGWGLDAQAGRVTTTDALSCGVVIREDLTADLHATDKLRAKLRAERGEVKFFDRGCESIEQTTVGSSSESWMPRQSKITTW
jgi:hypothetical protein